MCLYKEKFTATPFLPPLPRFRRTVGAVPPRYALPETEAAEVTEEGGRKTEGAGGRAKKEGATSPLPSFLPPSLIHPISHTFLSHLAEFAAEDCHLSVRPSASCPCVRLLWPTICIKLSRAKL